MATVTLPSLIPSSTYKASETIACPFENRL